MSWSTVDATASSFALAFAIFAEFITFAISIVVSLTILAGLITAASWWLQALCVFAHIFPEFIKLLGSQLVELIGV